MPHESSKSLKEKLALIFEGLKEGANIAKLEQVIGCQAVEIQMLKRNLKLL